jgi:hypothetical protein
MRLDCSKLESMVHAISLVQECDVIANGSLRISTPFTYPNGSHVDVFFEDNPGLFDSCVLSDLGQTFLYLNDALIKLDSTARKKQILDDICDELDVRFREGSFQVQLAGDQLVDVSDAIFRLSQACMRVSEFATHQRLRSANPFRDDVEEFFEASSLRYRPDVKTIGRFGKEVKIDFEVEGKNYVLVLAAMNESSAHSSGLEIFSKWYDLAQVEGQNGHRLITVYNSNSPSIRAVDIQRLGEMSQTIAYPSDQQLLKEVLTAA